MKRFMLSICLLAVSALIPGALRAQKLWVGAHGGSNIAKLAGDRISGQSSYARMIGGGFLVVEFSKYVAFQSELLYAQKGTKYIDSDEDVRTKIDYVEIPLLARLQLPTTSRVRPYGLVGPTVAINTGCRLDGVNENQPVDMQCDDPQLGWGVKHADFGVAFGLGAEMPLRRAFVGVDARYVLGVGGIYADRPYEVNNRAIGVMLGARFPLGGGPTVAARSSHKESGGAQ